MAYKLKFPFYIVDMNFLDDGSVQVPLHEHNVARIEENIHNFAKNFEKAFQKKVVDKGKYSQSLDYLQQAEYKKDTVQIEFKASKDRVKHPGFTLTYDFLYKEDERGFWGMIPALALEGFGEDEAGLKKTLEEGLKLEFARKKRLRYIGDVIETQWYNEIKVHEKEVTINYHTPAELATLHERKKEELLPKVAQKLSIFNKVAFGREKEIKSLADILKSKFGRNVIIVGPSGVGKTSLVWELAYQKKKHNIRQNIYETTASTLIKELTGDTGWQDNMAYLCRELAKKGDVLFIRNMLELFEVGQYEGNSVSMADYLRSYLSRGEISVISECTDEEYAKIELRSPNFLNLFQTIRLKEPKGLENIIIKKIDALANSRFKIEHEAVRETVRLNKRYMPYSGFPGKPVRFLESLLLNFLLKSDKENTVLDKALVYQQFSEEAGMPQFMIDPSVPMDLAQILQLFKSNIFGQDKAVHSVVDVLASVKTALARQGKPIASLLFVGPTGVGKTEMAKVLADFMFGSRDRMIRFDMSEYSDAYQVMRLTGVSYFQDGLLTSAVRQTPFSVILFDEIEKASPVFYDLLLQILSEGRLTDSSGKLVNFCSTIIIMTSNIGAASLQNGRIGWNKELDVEAVTEHFESAVQKFFRPELYNRIDQVVPFEPITKEAISYVVNREIKLLRKREGLAYREVDMKISDTVLEYVGEKGYNPKYGARQLQRAIRAQLVIPLAARLNDFPFDEKLEVELVMKDKNIDFQIETDPLKFDLLMEELTRNEFSDHAGVLRRSIQNLREGSFYIQLLSRLDFLESKKKKMGEKFWKTKKGEEYSYKLNTKDRIEKMSKIIDSYEEELMLVSMDLRPYDTTVIDKIKAWEEKYFGIKVELYSSINKESVSCRLGIYGREIHKMIDIYFQLIDIKKFTAAASTLWYRETYFNEMIEETIETRDEQTGNMVKTIISKPRHAYVSKAYDHNDKNTSLQPPKSGDLMVGMDIDIFGDCPYLFFSEENGFHRQKQTTKKQIVHEVICFPEIKKAEPPKAIHRKNYFQRKNARRVYAEGHIKDTIYKINREIIRDNLIELLYQAMNQRFGAKLDAELV